MGIASASVAAAGSIAQGIMGATQASKAKKAMQDYQRQRLRNVAQDISISTLGADYAARELARSSANTMQAIQGMGARGAMGAVQTVQDSIMENVQRNKVDLDRQFVDRERMIAQDEARIRAMQEQREQQDLAGLGQQLMVGQQNIFGGIAGLGQSGGMMEDMNAEVASTMLGVPSPNNINPSTGNKTNTQYSSTNLDDHSPKQ